MKTMKSLKINDEIEDILITLGNQYPIIRPVASQEGLFFDVVLDRAKGNLALARRAIRAVEGKLAI